MGRGVRILHISDLHVRGRSEPQAGRWRSVESQWDANLGELRADGRPVDLIAFTGDLADRGQPDDYPDAVSFLRALCEALEVDPCRLFLVPGNHDVARDVEHASWRALREAIGAAAPGAVSAWMAGGAATPPGFDDRWRDAVLERQAAFWNVVADDLGRSELAPAWHPPRNDGAGSAASSHPRLGYRATFSLDGCGVPIHVIGLDSAWLAGDEHDTGQLRLTEHQVSRLTTDEQGAPLPGLRLALVHHRFADLADGTLARRLLSNHVDVLLHGHQHGTTSDRPDAPDRAMLVVAAGGLYQSDASRRHQNALNVIDLELDDDGRVHLASIRFRSWSDGALRWTDDALLYPGIADGQLRVRRTRHGWAAGDPPPVPFRPRPAHRPVIDREPLLVAPTPGELPLTLDEAIARIRAETGEPPPPDLPILDLIRQIGCAPIALRLAAGHLRAGHSIDQFLVELAAVSKKPLRRSDLRRPEGAPPPRTLEDVLGVGLGLLARQAGARGAAFVAAYHALSWAPPAGFDRPLAAALTGLDEGGFDLDDLLSAAVELSLLDRAGDTWTVPPALGAIGRERISRKTIDARLRRHREVHAALDELPALRTEAYADDRAARAAVRTRIATILRMSGQRLAAIDVLQLDVLPLVQDDLAARISTLDAIAALLAERNQLDDAVEVLRRQALPLHERHRDPRARATTLDLLADVLMQRGDTVDSLRLRHDEELPLLTEAGDLAARAACLGKIANIYRAGGMLDRAITFLRRALADLAAPDLAAARAAAACDLALTLRARGAEPDYAESFTLLNDALDLARTHDAPRRDWIEAECAALGIR